MTANFKEYMGGLYLQRRLTHILLSATFHWRDKLTVLSFALFYFARVNPLKLTPVDADKIMRCERDKMGWGGKATVYCYPLNRLKYPSSLKDGSRFPGP